MKFWIYFPVCMTFFFKQQHAVWNLGCMMVVLCMGKDLFSPAVAANSRGRGATTPLILCSWPPIKPRPNQLQHNSSLLVLNPQNLMWAFLEGHGGCWTFTQAAELSSSRQAAALPCPCPALHAGGVWYPISSASTSQVLEQRDPKPHVCFNLVLVLVKTNFS